MITTNKFLNKWFPILLHIACLLPIPLLIFDAWRGNLSADPIRAAILRTGKIALLLLVFSLMCTPIFRIFAFKPAMRARRILGDYAFLYVCLHFTIIISLDYGFNIQYIFSELFQRPYALVGLATGIMLIPLAITSFKPWPKRLGKNWKRLHRLVYLIAILDALHFILSVKQGVWQPYLWLSLIIFLLILRIPAIRHFVGGIHPQRG